MFKIILIILALAAFGANSLYNSATGQNPAAPPAVLAPQPESSFGLSSMANMAVNAAASLAGGGVQTIPDHGCSESAVSVEKLNTFLMTLPEVQRNAIGKLLNSSSTVWATQFYSGSAGLGFCVPAHDKLILLPGLSEESMNALLLMVQDVQGFR